MAALPKMIYGGTKIGTVMYNEKEVHTIIEQQSNGTNIAVYHKHWGNKNTGGGCYTKRVTHKHTGNSSEGSGCYTKPVYHEHTEDCYNHTETKHGYLDNRCETDGNPSMARYTCSLCGEYVYSGLDSDDTGNEHCTQPGERTDLKCTKSESDIDYYDLNCGKNEGDLEYKLNCGFDLK